MDILFMVVPAIVVIGIFVFLWKVVNHPANWTNSNQPHMHQEQTDPWTYLRYRNPPY